MIQPYFDFLKRVWKSYFLIHSVISKERPERKMLRSCFLHSFHSFHFLKGHQILIPSKKRNQNNNNVRQGRVIAELYSSQLIASRRHLSKRYYRILLYILQILLIVPQVDSENRISYDHDAVQI